MDSNGESSGSDENDFDSESSDDEDSVVGEEDESESSDEELYTKEMFIRDLGDIKNNDSRVTKLAGSGGYDFIDNITNERWEGIGRDLSNNTHLECLFLYEGALNDEKMSYLCRGLMGSSSIKKLSLNYNEISAAGVRSMVPFLQRSNNILTLSLSENNIQSEGFDILCRALRDSPIEELYCKDCGIESIEIDIDQFPRHLKELNLSGNNISADGCRRGITKLLQRGDSALTHLFLGNNKIDNEGVAILASALKRNESLKFLLIMGNSGISNEGHLVLLKLVNDITSIKATLQSNHSLRRIYVDVIQQNIVAEGVEIRQHINMATKINAEFEDNPEAAGREKMIQTQLHSVNRAALATLQGVSHSVYSEINPLYLPEVLSLVGRRHGQDELFDALKSSIAGLIPTVNRKQFIKQQLEYHLRKVDDLRAELADIEAAEADVVASIHDSRQSKKT